MITRNTVMHEFAVRTLTVRSATTTAGTIRRITLEGSELQGFTSLGPGDHIRAFFPDPETGIVSLPARITGAAEQVGTPIFRDYTPLRFTPSTETTPASLDLEFVLHENPGPATAWAEHAQVGHSLTIAGPRGSKFVPEGASSVLLIADESALPALGRWLELLDENTPVTSIITVREEATRAYLSPEESTRANAHWVIRPQGAPDFVAEITALNLDLNGVYVWAAGEAGSLIPLRRHLKYTLELDRSQYEVDGYWKRGVSNLDHHAPLDESDPD